jgi:hypothetical protein
VEDINAGVDARIEPAAVPAEIEQGANHIARYVHRNGSVYRFDFEKMIAGMSRRMSIDEILDCAVTRDWLIVNGRRVSPGATEPELVTCARYAMVGDGLG